MPALCLILLVPIMLGIMPAYRIRTNTYWRGTKFGELVNRHVIAKFKSHQYIFFYGISVVTLVAFE